MQKTIGVGDSDSKNIQFDDISKLDKPNIDWIVTKRLDEATFWLSQSYFAVQGRLKFIGCVEALVKVCRYYWQTDPEFTGRLNTIIAEGKEALLGFSDGGDTDGAGRNKTDVTFSISNKKFDLVMETITKNTKDIPKVDRVM